MTKEGICQLKCKILLIDDNPEDTKLDIQKIFVKEQPDLFEYIGCINNEDQLTYEAIKEADILVVDYYLEEGGWSCNGDAIIKKIKQEWEIDIDVILYTRGLSDTKQALELVSCQASSVG